MTFPEMDSTVPERQAPATRVGVVGAGYVGLTSAVCLAAKGVDVVCVDTDEHRVASLSRGVAVIDEPGLPELLAAGLAGGALEFADDYGALAQCDVVFVCVPTPTREDGSADLAAVESCVHDLARVLRRGSVVAVKSTVPVGTCRRLARLLATSDISVVSNPEFLRENHAIWDFQHPDRVVVGSADAAGCDVVASLYQGDAEQVLQMSMESAELAKYASNSFLAVKLSFVNSLAELCARVGADLTDVTGCMGADPRINPHFLMPGPGWGGSCLPKDTAALVHTGRAHGIALREVESARRTNAAQAVRVVNALRRSLNRPLADARVAAFGVTFKAGTSDVRDSPALGILSELHHAGAHVVAYDPRLDNIDLRGVPVPTTGDPYVAAKDADAILVLTEWPEFVQLDWAAISRNASDRAVVLDTRKLLASNAVESAGLFYLGNGAPSGY